MSTLRVCMYQGHIEIENEGEVVTNTFLFSVISSDMCVCRIYIYDVPKNFFLCTMNRNVYTIRKIPATANEGQKVNVSIIYD